MPFPKGHKFGNRYKKGEVPWNYGKKGYKLPEFTEEHKNKLSEARKKIIGWKHKIGTRKKIGDAQRGDKHWNWQGGISDVKLQIRKIWKYRQWRSDVYERDDYTCQLCSKRGGKLECDHYPKKFANILKENNIKTVEDALCCEELWNLNNGRTLCYKCHHSISPRC